MMTYGRICKHESTFAGGVCYADTAAYGEAESFEQSDVQCFQDLRRGAEIAEASSGSSAASRRDRRGEPRCGIPAANPDVGDDAGLQCKGQG